MWQTKYALAVPKNLGVGVNFLQCSEDHFLSDDCQTKRKNGDKNPDLKLA